MSEKNPIEEMPLDENLIKSFVEAVNQLNMTADDGFFCASTLLLNCALKGKLSPKHLKAFLDAILDRYQDYLENKDG